MIIQTQINPTASGEDPVFGQIRIQGSERRERIKFLLIDILDDFNSLGLCFHTFNVRRPLQVPDPVRILLDPGWFSESRTSKE